MIKLKDTPSQQQFTAMEPKVEPMHSPPTASLATMVAVVSAVPQAPPPGSPAVGDKRKRDETAPPPQAVSVPAVTMVPPVGPTTAATAHAVHAPGVPPMKKANTTAICTDCGIKHASFGTKEDRKRRWCGACAKSNGHPDAVNVNAKMCEDCGVKMASFGTQNDHKKRWCSGCAKTKQHSGAEYLGKRYMCEDCDKKRAAWGDGTDKKRRWCGSCVKANRHAGATIIGVKLCEDCNDKQATFGVEPEKVRGTALPRPLGPRALCLIFAVPRRGELTSPPPWNGATETPMVRELRKEQDRAEGCQSCQRNDVRGLWVQACVVWGGSRPQDAVVRQLCEGERSQGGHRVPYGLRTHV